jgi:hypothetical protein
MLSYTLINYYVLCLTRTSNYIIHAFIISQPVSVHTDQQLMLSLSFILLSFLQQDCAISDIFQG